MTRVMCENTVMLINMTYLFHVCWLWSCELTYKAAILFEAFRITKLNMSFEEKHVDSSMSIILFKSRFEKKSYFMFYKSNTKCASRKRQRNREDKWTEWQCEMCASNVCSVALCAFYTFEESAGELKSSNYVSITCLCLCLSCPSLSYASVSG